MADGLRVYIKGVERQVHQDTLVVEDRIEERAVCRFDLVMDTGGPPSPAYTRGDPMYVLQGASTTIFKGFIDTATLMPRGPDAWVYSVQCMDLHYLADRRVVAKSYTGQTAGYIFKDIRDTYLVPEGISNSDAKISAGPTISEIVFNYVSAATALAALAELANFYWRIGPDSVMEFRARDADPVGTTLTDAHILRRENKAIAHGNPRYRNRQYIRGGHDITDSQVESFMGDGEVTAFTVGFPIAKVPTVKVNTVTKTVGIKALDTGKDWYWAKGDPSVVQDIGGSVLTSSDTLEVTYQGEFEFVALSYDDAEIALVKAREGQGTGYVEDVEEVARYRVPNRTVAFELANAKLEKFGTIGKRLTFASDNLAMTPGQLLTVNLPNFGISNEDFLVESVVKAGKGRIGLATAEGEVYWTVTAASGPQLGEWTEFFHRIAAQPTITRLINIGTGTVLTVYVPVSEGWAWGETAPTVTVWACPVPSTTTYPSASTYPC